MSQPPPAGDQPAIPPSHAGAVVGIPGGKHLRELWAKYTQKEGFGEAARRREGSVAHRVLQNAKRKLKFADFRPDAITGKQWQEDALLAVVVLKHDGEVMAPDAEKEL